MSGPAVTLLGSSFGWIPAVLESAALIAGTVLIFLGAIGLVRLPDIFTRMQAAAKTSTLGFALVMLAVIPYFESLSVSTRALLAVMFLFLTAPIGAHLIARAASRTGVRLWSGSARDERR